MIIIITVLSLLLSMTINCLSFFAFQYNVDNYMCVTIFVSTKWFEVNNMILFINIFHISMSHNIRFKQIVKTINEIKEEKKS